MKKIKHFFHHSVFDIDSNKYRDLKKEEKLKPEIIIDLIFQQSMLQPKIYRKSCGR